MLIKLFYKPLLFIILMLGVNSFAVAEMVEVKENWILSEIKDMIDLSFTGSGKCICRAGKR
ncbi:hypothetical protein [Lonepinella koalarum]|uniref:hypothetical protein n=1 Tax=Lonepinella koalarum TaxID=53417 RepID=UPI003F6DE358